MRLAKALCVKRKFYRRRGKIRFEVNPFKFMTREILFKLQYTWIFQFVHETGSGLPLPSPPLPSTTFHFCYPLQCISYQEHSLNNRVGYPSFLHKFETIIFTNHKLKLSNIPCHNISRFVAKIYWWRQYIHKFNNLFFYRKCKLWWRDPIPVLVLIRVGTGFRIYVECKF